MPLILGIDTGGTYTDGVLVDGGRGLVVGKAKALTTGDDLSVGIRNCLDRLAITDYEQIKLVSVSTTLATNAIVEGKGCEAGLLVIGQLPDGKLPAKHMQVLRGRFDIRGKMLSSLDKEECLSSIELLRGKVDAVAISGYASVRNPSHELAVKSMVRQILGVPVVCAHELTSSLGFYDRTVTALLNARLIPLIGDLVCAVQNVLAEKAIKAPIMIVKGDGSVMNAEAAREKPIETILSGPAASVNGGIFLTGAADALMLDMGGTTTDIANVENGKVRIQKEGARVGGWLTRVNSAEIYTYGIGGDSYLRLAAGGKLRAGPRKVCPLSVAGRHYPYLAAELRAFGKPRGYELVRYSECDCFKLLKDPGGMELSPADQKAADMLRTGPHSLFYLAEAAGCDADALALDKLVDAGVVGLISLTPTDILHVCGVYSEWDTAAAAIGAQKLADAMGLTVDEFTAAALSAVNNELCFSCLQGLAGFEQSGCDLVNDKAARYLTEKAFYPEKQQLFSTSFRLNKPIVAIGAPVRAWLGAVAQKLGAELIVPEHAEVANAIGAAVGRVAETARVLIRAGEGGDGFIAYARGDRRLFDRLAEAVDFAWTTAREQASAAAVKAGSRDFELIEYREDIYNDAVITGRRLFLEARIEVTAVGRPDWQA